MSDYWAVVATVTLACLLVWIVEVRTFSQKIKRYKEWFHWLFYCVSFWVALAGVFEIWTSLDALMGKPMSQDQIAASKWIVLSLVFAICVQPISNLIALDLVIRPTLEKFRN